MSHPCAKCGSTKIIPYASIQDQGEHSDGKLKAVVFTNPDAWIFRGAVKARLLARICGECGNTELIATNAPQLYKAYQSSLRRSNSPASALTLAKIRRKRRMLKARKNAAGGKSTAS